MKNEAKFTAGMWSRDRMVAAGAPAEQAEAIVVELYRIEESMENKTQVQFAELLARVDAGFETMRSEMDSRFETMRSEMDSRFETMRSEMDSRFETMRSEMDSRFETMPTRSEVEAAVAKSSLARTVQTIGWAVAVVAALLGGIFVF